MKRIVTLLAFIALTVGLMQAQHRGNYVVLVAAVEGYVPQSSFKGLNGVYSTTVFGDINRYYVGGFTDKASAEAVASNARNIGFVNARVLDIQYLRDMAASCCGAPTPVATVEEDFKVRNIFFDFDKSYLRAESKRELDKIYSILTRNPSYTLEVHAHTDSKGSNEYNVALAERRKQSAISYLTARGISANRIRPFSHGEETPVAKNETVAGDSPQGRQLNRRVEFRIKDGGVDLNKVEDISVPAHLRQ